MKQSFLFGSLIFTSQFSIIVERQRNSCVEHVSDCGKERHTNSHVQPKKKNNLSKRICVHNQNQKKNKNCNFIRKSVFIFAEELEEICKEYYERMYVCEGQKWDLEYEVRKRDWEVLPKHKKKQKQTKNNILSKVSNNNNKYIHKYCPVVFFVNLYFVIRFVNFIHHKKNAYSNRTPFT